MEAKTTHGNLFNKFLDYYERQWIKKVKKYIHIYTHTPSVHYFCHFLFCSLLIIICCSIHQEGPEKISVFGRHARTTASLEAYNCALNSRIKTKGSFYGFALAIIDVEFSKRRELETLVESGGGSVRAEKRSVSHNTIFIHFAIA